MHKIDGKNATEDGQFQEYDPATGQGATYITADWLNAVQGELIAILEAQEVDPSKASSTQVLDALDGRFALKAELSANGGADLVGYQGGTVSGALASLSQGLLNGLSGGAPVYADTAAGLAATSEDGYFNVPSSDPNEIYIVYRHDAGPVATEMGRTPSSAAVSELGERIPEIAPVDFAWAILDANGRAAIGVKGDGTLAAQDVEAEKVTAKTVGTPGGNIQDGAPDGFRFAILDANGHGNGVKDDGTLSWQDAEIRELTKVQTINGTPIEEFGGGSAPDAPIWPRPSGYTAELNGVLSYGQSLSIGSTSRPVISTTQPYNTLMFVGGVRALDGGTDPGVIYASLVPLVEQENGGLGETPVAGMTENLVELIQVEDGIAHTDHSYQFLGSAPGNGGTPIAGLRKGSIYYPQLVNDITYGAARAADLNQSYAAQAITWMQGEADYFSGTPYAEYKEMLAQLCDDIRSDSMSITGQPFPPVMISYQVGSHLRYAQSQGVESAFNAEIAQAQLDLGNEKEGFYCACPMYQFDYSGTVDQVHLNATDSKVAGAYFGLVYKRTVIDGQDWRPLQPVSIQRSGRALVLNMHVPKPPMVFDTTWVSLNEDYGFRVFDGAGNRISIASVEIINSSSVKITTAVDIPAGTVTVDYALFSDSATGETGRVVGARGNLRDSQGDTVVFDPDGINRPLHNWCAMFKISTED